MLPQSNKSSRGLFFTLFLQVLLIFNQRDQITPFRYINQDYQVSRMVRVRKFLGDMKHLMRSVKRIVEAVGIWTEESFVIKN